MASTSTRWLRRIAVVVLVGVSVIVAGQWVLHRSYFSVREVQLSGAVHESRAQILAVSGLDRHPAMIDLNDAVVSDQLDRLQWVLSATVTKRWPNTVIIAVTERTATAVAYDGAHHLQLVDGTGRDLAPVVGPTNLPLLVAAGAPSAPWPYDGWAESVAQVAAALPAAFSAQVASVNVTSKGVISLEMTTPLTFVLGTTSQLHDKFVAVAAVLAHGQLHSGDVVDVTVPGTVAVSGP